MKKAYYDNPEVKARVKALRNERGKAHYRKRYAWFYELKSTLSCCVCGESHMACIEFHHREPSTKLFTISTAVVHPKQYTREMILEEIDKCAVMCRNCHAKFHWNTDDVVTRNKT